MYLWSFIATITIIRLIPVLFFNYTLLQQFSLVQNDIDDLVLGLCSHYNRVHVSYLLHIYELPHQIINPYYYTRYFHAYVITKGTVSIYLFIPFKVTVYTSELKKLKHNCAGAQSTHVRSPQTYPSSTYHKTYCLQLIFVVMTRLQS